MKTQIKTIIKVALLVPAFILLSACNNKKSNNTAAATNQCIQTQTGQPADPVLCQQGQYGYSYSNGINNQYGYNNQYGGQYGQQQFGQYQRIQCVIISILFYTCYRKFLLII